MSLASPLSATGGKPKVDPAHLRLPRGAGVCRTVTAPIGSETITFKAADAGRGNKTRCS